MLSRPCQRVKARTLIELEVFRVLTPEQRAMMRRMRDTNRDQRTATPDAGPDPGRASDAPPDVPGDDDTALEDAPEPDVEPATPGPGRRKDPVTYYFDGEPRELSRTLARG